MSKIDKNKIPSEVILIFISSLFLMFGLVGLSERANPFINTLFSPISRSSAAAANILNTTVESVDEINSIRQERNDLMVENVILKGDNASVPLLKQELELLRKELNIPKDDRFSPLEVRVVSSRNEQLDNYLIIDNGSSDDVNDGDTVRFGNIYIGKTKDVSDHSSRVELPTYSNSFLEVSIIPSQENLSDLSIADIELLISSPDRKVWKGVAVGKSNGVEIQNIEKNAPIKNGDHIFVTDADISRILYLGDVSELSTTVSDVGITAKVILPVNFSNLINLIVDSRID